MRIASPICCVILESETMVDNLATKPGALRTLTNWPDDLAGQRVFVRVDFNVPLQESKVLDASRIEAALPTLCELRRRGAVLLCASHCGRPQGQVQPEWSLAPVAEELSHHLDSRVTQVADCIGEPVRETTRRAQPGDVLMLENLRFHSGETDNRAEFADALAENVDLFVGDAFGAAHRDHASVTGVAQRVAGSVAGSLMEREVAALEALLDRPRQPFIVILGGAKMGGKIATLQNLLPRADRILLGGGIANTFLAAQGKELGGSLVEESMVETARAILRQAQDLAVEILLPNDVTVTTDLDSVAGVENRDVGSIAADQAAVDLGPESIERYRDGLSDAGTVLWNGPMGVFERPPFDRGTMDLARALGDLAATRVVGGGETVAAVKQAGVADQLDHVSTGGGAMLSLLAGTSLPGVEVLRGDL